MDPPVPPPTTCPLLHFPHARCSPPHPSLAPAPAAVAPAAHVLGLVDFSDGLPAGRACAVRSRKCRKRCWRRRVERSRSTSSRSSALPPRCVYVTVRVCLSVSARAPALFRQGVSMHEWVRSCVPVCLSVCLCARACSTAQVCVYTLRKSLHMRPLPPPIPPPHMCFTASAACVRALRCTRLLRRAPDVACFLGSFCGASTHHGAGCCLLPARQACAASATALPSRCDLTPSACARVVHVCWV